MKTSTERERVAIVGFYALAVLLLYLIYQLFRPFLTPLAWAAVLAVCFYPTQLGLEHHVSRGRAALLTTTAVALLVIGPMLVVGSIFVSEASRILEAAPGLLADTPGRTHRWVAAALEYVPGGETIDPAALLADSAKRLAAFLSEQAAGILQDVVLFVVDLVITLFALFFLFRDAEGLMSAIRRIVPIDPDIRERLIDEMRLLITASVTSGLIVAAIQGVLGGLAFWLVGLKAPVFWGVVMAFFCLLPFGAWVVWAPAALWLLASGHVGRGLVLAALGVGIVSAIDNFLRPFLLSGQSGMNGLLLFISMLGGVMAFGTVGLVLGPVLMATAVSLFDVFMSDAAAPPGSFRG